MKKLIIALLAIGVAATAMARYGVYQLMLKGQFVEGQPDKGKYIYNGMVDEVFPAPKKGNGTLKAVLLEDEEYGASFVFIKDDGGWMQTNAYFEVSWFEKLVKENDDGPVYKWMEQGMVDIYLEFGFFEVDVYTVMNGNYKYSEEVNGEFKWQYTVNAVGAGDGYKYDEDLDETVGVAIKNAKIKYDNNRSHQMSDAYYAVVDGGGSESAGVAAAEAWLAAYLGDGADPDLPEL